MLARARGTTVTIAKVWLQAQLDDLGKASDLCDYEPPDGLKLVRSRLVVRIDAKVTEQDAPADLRETADRLLADLDEAIAAFGTDEQRRKLRQDGAVVVRRGDPQNLQ